MKFLNSSIVLGLLFFLLPKFLTAQVSLKVITDKEIYEVGEEIQIFFTAANTSIDTVTLNFPESCQAEYILGDYYSGNAHGCWTAHSSVTILPESSYTWESTYPYFANDDYDLLPGSYNLFGKLLYQDLADTCSILIKQITSIKTLGLKENGISLNNYPNPFNSSTKINYKVNKGSFIKLNIYNAAGQQIKSLINSFKNVGEYSVKWESGAKLHSGVYFLVLQTEEERIVHKALYLK